jgi:flavin reductase (DIM6/NTAB) family NADH-FMN oxidoreductase RutF
MTKIVEPPILYLGTPVVLISTLNLDGSANLSPMSSAWWLGWSAILGLDASSKTTENLLRERQGVLNLPSAGLVGSVDRLALTTGSNPVPRHKRFMGYRYEPDKFGTSGLTPVPSEEVRPPRVAECPVQLEAVVEDIRPMARNDRHMLIPVVTVEARIVRVHVDDSILMPGTSDRIDPEKWRPLIMSFRQFFGLGPILQSSRLSQFPEEIFAPPKETSQRKDSMQATASS